MGTGTDRTFSHEHARDRAQRPSILGRFRASYRQRDEDHLIRAYSANLSQRVPPLYGLVILAVTLLAMRFHGTAPAVLTEVVPAMMSVLALWRLAYWLPARVRRRSIADLRRDLRTMNWVSGFSAAILVGWAVAIYPHGDAAQQSLVHYVISVIGFCGILCLAEAPLTALFFGLSLAVPSTLFFVMNGHPNAVFISVVQATLTCLLLVVANAHHRDFVRLELSREEIVRRERHAARLAADNLANATYDALTGVLNRRAFLSLLERAMNDATGASAWLALVDLDGFKHVNDTYGHAAGDALLKTVAIRIGAQDGVTAYGRLGGDEFALLLDGAYDSERALAAMKDLSRKIAEPVADRGTVLRLSACIGMKRTEGRSVNECLERVDSALYKAKEDGDGAVCMFAPEDEVALRQRVAITRTFNAASLNDTIRLLYQPVWDIESEKVVAYEALARWTPDGGETWLQPSTFIPLADATGRTGELTRAILARALGECRVWEQGLTLGVNLAPRDVLRDGSVESIEQVVREAGAPPETITFDVTERALILDPKRAMHNLQAFRDRGFRISFDDFGAGLASLGNIHRLPLDVLKIDRGLTRALATDAGARALAGTILTLAWQLDIDCVIEGVETEAQTEVARALGIRLMQGYRFGRPLPVEEALAGRQAA
ncbi:EAL domain-containing protein [Novosphingobium sp. ZN18A2]|uniref:putative bifunctional diguanylate cyclase/phosphodiesterase n=1 Tax=Novosphingobium sp. ZN18A2 TaxID=3079861 RepID=UPI0030D1910A